MLSTDIAIPRTYRWGSGSFMRGDQCAGRVFLAVFILIQSALWKYAEALDGGRFVVEVKKGEIRVETL